MQQMHAAAREQRCWRCEKLRMRAWAVPDPWPTFSSVQPARKSDEADSRPGSRCSDNGDQLNEAELLDLMQVSAEGWYFQLSVKI